MRDGRHRRQEHPDFFHGLHPDIAVTWCWVNAGPVGSVVASEQELTLGSLRRRGVPMGRARRARRHVMYTIRVPSQGCESLGQAIRSKMFTCG